VRRRRKRERCALSCAIRASGGGVASVRIAMVDWCSDDDATSDSVTHKAMGGERPFNFEALDKATKDSRRNLSVNNWYNNHPVLKEQVGLLTSLDAAEDAEEWAKLTASERAALKASMEQDGHAATLKQRRAERAMQEALEQERGAANAPQPGVLGKGMLSMAVGDVAGAYECKVEFKDVTILVPLPDGVTAKMLAVAIGVSSLELGLKGKSPYLKAQLGGRVLTDDSVWLVEEGKTRHVRIELTKANTKEQWPGALSLPEGWECRWSL